MDDLHTNQKNRICQYPQDGVKHSAERAAALRPRQQRRVRVVREGKLPGKYDEALGRRVPRQGWFNHEQ